MIFRLKDERALNTALDSVITKNIDYVDNLKFRIPYNEELNIDDILVVKSEAINQKYRVHEIDKKSEFKEVFARHIFFDIEKIVIPSLPKTQSVTLEYLASHINRILNEKSFDFKVDSKIQKVGSVDIDNTSLFDLIFKEDGILEVFNCKVIWDNNKIKFVDDIPGKNTELLFHENKNIVEMQASENSKDVVTRLYVTVEYKPDNNTPERQAELEQDRRRKQEILENKRREKFDEYNSNIASRQQAEDEARRVRRQEQDSHFFDKQPRRNKQQIYNDMVARRQVEDSNRATRRQNSLDKRTTDFNNKLNESRRKFEEREQARKDKALIKEQEKQERTFKTVIESPLIGNYQRVYEASIKFSSSEIDSQEALERYCQDNFFTDDDTRDVPLKSFTFKTADVGYVIGLRDIARVQFKSLDNINKNVPCCEFRYDPIHNKYIGIEFGDIAKNPKVEKFKSISKSFNEKVKSIKDNQDSKFNGLLDEYDIQAMIEREREAFELTFANREEELKKEVNDGIHDAELKAIERSGDLALEIETKITEAKQNTQETIDRVKKDLQSDYRQLVGQASTNTTQAIESAKSELNETISSVRTNAESLVDNAKQEATRLSDEAKQVARDLVGNISVGGQNLLLRTRNFNERIWLNQGATIENEQYLNFKVLKSIGLNKYYYQNIDNVEAGVYTFSAYVKGNDFTYLFLKFGENNTRIDKHMFKVDLTDEWIRFKCTFEVLEKGSLNICFYRNLNDETKVFYTCGWKLETGNIATDWSPAWEDYRYQIEVLKNGFREKLPQLEAKDNEFSEFMTEIEKTTNGINEVISGITQKFDDNGKLKDLESFKVTNESNLRAISSNLEQVQSKFNSNGELQSLANYKNDMLRTVSGINSEISTVKQKFNTDGTLKELVQFKNERVETDRDITRRLSELQVYKDGENERRTAIENKITETARGTEQRIFENYSNLGLNYLRNTKTFDGEWYHGNNWLKESEKQEGFTVMSRTGAWRGITQSIYSEAQQWWTFSCYLRSDDITRVYAYSTHGSDTATVIENYSKNIDITNTFVKYSFTFKVGNAGYIRPRIESSGNGKYYIYKMKLEKGKIATPWTPHIDDNERFITDRLVEVNNTINGINTSVSSIERKVNDTKNLADSINSSFTSYKTTREQTDRQITEKITALEVYKNADGTRQDRILQLAETKTNELLSREISNISNTYVNKTLFEQTQNGFNTTVTNVTNRLNDLTIGGRNYILKSDIPRTDNQTLELSVDFIKEVNEKRYMTLSCYVTGSNLTSEGNNRYGIAFNAILDSGNAWVEAWQTGTDSVTEKLVTKTWKIPDGKKLVRVERLGYYKQIGGTVEIKKGKLECSSFRTEWTPAPEDNLKAFESYKTERQQTDREILDKVTTLEGDALKKSEFRITDSGIELASGKVINGQTMASIIKNTPTAISLISENVVITTNNENLTLPKHRTTTYSNARTRYVTGLIPKHNAGDEFLISGIASIVGGVMVDLGAVLTVRYTDNTIDYITKPLIGYAFSSDPRKFEGTLKIPKTSKSVLDVQIGFFQDAYNDFTNWRITDCLILKKKHANLIVDGSITAKHLDINSIKTGILTAGSIDAEMISSRAISANHLKVDQALIDKLFVEHLLVRNATIENIITSKINAIEIDASAIRSGYIDVKRINISGVLKAYKGVIGGFKIGENENDGYYDRWLTGDGNFSIGMSDGNIRSTQTALWVNWGDKWDTAGQYAWYVQGNGKMYCKNTAHFSNNPVVYSDLVVHRNIRNGNGDCRWNWSYYFDQITQADNGNIKFVAFEGQRFGDGQDKEVKIVVGSDRRYKENIKETKVKSLELLENIKCYSYDKNFIDDKGYVHCGIMAQDVEKYIPDAYTTFGDGIKTYDTFKLTPYLIKAIQELNQKVEELEKKVLTNCV